MPAEDAIRRTGESLFERLEELRELEARKLGLKPGTPAQLRLARRVEELAEALLLDARRESSLSEQIALSEPATRPTSIAPPREIPVVLDDWRDAERRLVNGVPGSAAWLRARDDVTELRDEYRRAYDLRGRGP